MTHNEKLEAIRGKVIEANPNEYKLVCRYCGATVLVDCNACRVTYGRPIRLADVMMALFLTHKLFLFSQTTYNEFVIKVRDVAYRPNDGGCIWNLLRDDLNLQSKEMINFLYDVLCQK